MAAQGTLTGSSRESTVRMGKNGVTINDVAKNVGVSKVTVSYVLNGRQTGVRISDRTRQRVIAAASELGYHPNALARGLARRQTDTLALVMQFPSVFSGWSGFINELMHGATDAATELGFDLMLHTKPQQDIDRDIAALTDGRADGALLLRDKGDPMAALLTEREYPFVQIFSHSDIEGSCSVDCDNLAGARLAVEHLHALGHRRIGHLAGSPQSLAAADRMLGYRLSLERHGITPNPAWLCEITHPGGDPQPLLDLMAQLEPPTALFAWSDDVGVWAMRQLREKLGLRTPEDVSIVGFDGAPVGDQVTPRLSSIQQPIYEMASRGVSMLASLIRGEALDERKVVFQPALLGRSSCRPVEGYGERLTRAEVRG